MGKTWIESFRYVTVLAILSACAAHAQTAPTGPGPAPPPGGGPNFGTSPADEAKRQVVFGWATLLRQDRAKAMSTYMSANFKEHPGSPNERGAQVGPPPGAVPGGPPRSGGFTEAAKTPDGRRGQLKFGPKGQSQDLHMVATVDGDMVTLFWSGGVDLFKVENGKITAHWDASPQTTLTIYGPEDSSGPPPGPTAAPK